MTETIAGAKELVHYFYTLDIPTWMHGPPGVGKSAIARQLTEELEIGFKDVRVSQKLPEDFNGIPTADLENMVARWLKAEFWPDPKRDGAKGILMLDELSDASKMVQTACYQLILDRRIGEYELPDGWWPLAAGNRRQDRAAAQTISTALANRFAHIDIEPDVESFICWGIENKLHEILEGFLRFRKNLLHSMEGADLRAFPTPRSWMEVSRVLHSNPPVALRFRLIRSLVGEGAAGELESYIRTASQLPDFEEIMANPERAMIPENPSCKYALACMIARNATRGNFKKVLTYVSRSAFGPDFEVVAVRDAVRHEPAIAESKAYVEWAAENAQINT